MLSALQKDAVAPVEIVRHGKAQTLEVTDQASVEGMVAGVLALTLLRPVLEARTA